MHNGRHNGRKGGGVMGAHRYEALDSYGRVTSSSDLALQGYIKRNAELTAGLREARARITELEQENALYRSLGGCSVAGCSRRNERVEITEHGTRTTSPITAPDKEPPKPIENVCEYWQGNWGRKVTVAINALVDAVNELRGAK